MDLDAIRAEALGAISEAADEAAVERLRVLYLGRRSALVGVLRTLGELPAAERAAAGQRANEAKLEIERGLVERTAALRANEESGRGEREWFDLSLPARRPAKGHLHPITQLEEDLDHLFRGMGFRVLEGPWVEDEWHNFDALNIPSWHPARDSWDTFWLSDGNLLRTHTSPVQIRAMRRFGAPLRAVLPGRCFRNEAIDATHEAVFSQIEGLVIDREIQPGHLFHSIRAIVGAILAEDVETRFRPSFFPFTEPSFECDVKRPDGRWMELCGMGMVHPKVLEAGGLDPARWSGFAFGMGLDRLALQRLGIDDIRWFHSGDLRFLEQF